MVDLSTDAVREVLAPAVAKHLTTELTSSSPRICESCGAQPAAVVAWWSDAMFAVCSGCIWGSEAVAVVRG